MKKILILITLILVSLTGFKQSDNDEVIIPDEAIRFRVVAASNSEEDQQIKTQVKDALQVEIENVLSTSKDLNETRTILKNNINYFEDVIKRTLLTNKNMSDYKIHYGLNYFPKKEYKGVIYEEGYYESLVVTLGNGNGDNWWCVLFPPLCLLEAQETDTQDVEYKFFVQDLIDKYMKD